MALKAKTLEDESNLPSTVLVSSSKFNKDLFILFFN